MNIDFAPQKPALAPTGYPHIDNPFATEQQTLGTAMKFKSLADPVGVKLLNSRVTEMTPIGFALNSETDFLEVATNYWYDGFVRRIVDAYINLVLKSGYTIKGSDQRAVQYLKTRLRTLSLSSGQSFEKMLETLAFCIVLFGNAFLIKVPFKGNNPIPGFRLRPGPGKKPIGGFFFAHPATMHPVVDFDGNIIEWRYIVSGIIRKSFLPDEVIHITYNRPPNVIWGQPFFLPTLEDVRTLRQVEYQTVMLVNRYINPIIHVKRGLTHDGKLILATTADSLADIDDAIRMMGPDGTLITTADVDIEVHGMQGQSLDAAPFLNYWKRRVLGGMGASAIMMGDAPAGMATAESLTAEMQDMAESFQRCIRLALEEEVFFDMLQEGGFDPINNEDVAGMEWNPISLEKEIKARTEATAEWQNGALTIDEYRRALRREPFQPGDEDKTFFAMQARYGNGLPEPDKSVDNKLRPAGRYGKKSSPGGKVIAPTKKEDANDLESLWQQFLTTRF